MLVRPRSLGRGLAAAVLLALAIPAAATIVATSGNIVKWEPPPADVSLGGATSDTQIFAFDERGAGNNCLVLTNDMETDDGVIVAGTSVECHFFHAEPVTGLKTLTGRARFDDVILGVISESALLDASTECERGIVTYPALGAELDRGLEPTQGDSYTTSAAGDAIEIRTVTDVGTSDQVRVVTACNAAIGGPDTGDGGDGF